MATKNEGWSPKSIRSLQVGKSRLLQGLIIFFTYSAIFGLIPVLQMQLQAPPNLQINSETSPASINILEPPSLKILVGILTTSARFERRSLLRLAYSLQPPAISADVKVRFVLGKPKSKEEADLVELEKIRFNDIIQLDCKENMDEGKSFTYFSTVPSLGIKYDYVMKADDDAYILLENLAHSLQLHPREDLYYGLPLPNHPSVGFMTGEGYVLSWDLVEWISVDPIPRNMSVGKEDLLPKLWFNQGNKAKHRTNMKHLFYDHPAHGGEFAHDFIPETILIHQLKSLDRWMDVLSFFELRDKRNSSTS